MADLLPDTLTGWLFATAGLCALISAGFFAAATIRDWLTS